MWSLRDLIVPGCIVAVIATMLIPLPEGILNVLLVGNIMLAVVLLFSSIYIREPMKLTVLPTLLLLATLYRLALNISTTRLILSTASGGEVIEAFGNIVIQGNLIVGSVVFLIITLVQFIVVAKGAERVAEVSARFTLDALPGKQMSIDADVRAGLIDSETAKKKREELQVESRFYGALDGAMKFVKGDAIAGLVITGINVVGGLLLGVFSYNLSIGEAAGKFTLLTIGDGLLSQIPALLNATSAGIMVTRVVGSKKSSLASDLVAQLTNMKQVQILASLTALALAITSGMPFIPFVAIAGILAISSFVAEEQENEESKEEFTPALPPPIQIVVSKETAKILIEVKDIDERIDSVRKEIFDRTGLLLLPMPLSLLPDEGEGSENKTAYVIKIRGLSAFKRLPIEDVDKLSEDERNKIVTRLWSDVKDTIISHKCSLVDDMLTRRLLDLLDREAPELVSAAVPGAISLTQLTVILRALVEENIPIRQFDVIVQAIAEFGHKCQDEKLLLIEVRKRLGRTITEMIKASDGKIKAITIDPILDLRFSRNEGNLNEHDMELLNLLTEKIQQHPEAVVLCSGASRRTLYELLTAKKVAATVVGIEEIDDGYSVEIVDSLFVDEVKGKMFLEEMTQCGGTN